MGETAASRVLNRLAASNRRLAVIATGGGTRAISDLCGTPGASRVVIEGLVPYAAAAVDGILGGPQEHSCSDRTARRLAVAAWQRAVRLASPDAAMGAAVTASLATVMPKRGSHRVHAAVQTATATRTASLELTKGGRSRAEEESIAASLVLRLIDAVCGTISDREAFEGLPLLPGESIQGEGTNPSPALQSLFVGSDRVMRAVPVVGRGRPGPLPEPESVIFPGSFDPLHDGHRRMATLASEIAERPVAFELSIANVDKPMLDFLEIRAREAQFAPPATLWLTKAATFLEKIELFPRATFVMGADTFARLADPRYYGGSEDATALAVRSIAEGVGGLIVFGRAVDGAFQDPSRMDVPEAIREKAYFVSQREFCMDVSSTSLRRQASRCEPS